MVTCVARHIKRDRLGQRQLLLEKVLKQSQGCLIRHVNCR